MGNLRLGSIKNAITSDIYTKNQISKLKRSRDMAAFIIMSSTVNCFLDNLEKIIR